MAFNIYKWRRNQLLTENNSVITKTIKDLTLGDVEELAMPTKSFGVYHVMHAIKDLNSWKSNFSEEEQNELEVTIDKNAEPWFNKVKIENLTQSDPIGYQAGKDIEKGKKPSLD